MQPFSLVDIDTRESFKEQFKKDFKSLDWPAGAFDYELVITSDLTQDQKDNLCEWLAYNCKKNFIVFEKTNTRLAGGSSDNLADWKRRHIIDIYSKFDTISTVTVRLSKEDITLFRMVWF